MATILVVEDDPALRTVWQHALNTHGFSVVLAKHGRQALTVLDNLLPDLVITDLTMPWMSGPQLIQAMQDDPRLAPIPVLCITGDAWATHPTGYPILEKPFPVAELIDNVRAIVGGATERHAGGSSRS